ncbi:hypothetical protein WICMUC_005830 [Wickerhamomyces mucosus]|uniref:Zn(2)-C6 fungal-type domain-containing protein n=1 Tax=Wickerhamomyces mucosus TaxID=1378264 RepID=A0A9P8T3W8_9ASCO|nr:hypothetical protein WICMUC_005830 [Wickerhamomyces mucosus]
MTKSQPNKPKPKRTNTRPCDACAVRRVRCDLHVSGSSVCTNCQNHNIKCTNIRIRHKSGPKKIKDKTRENIENLVSSSARSSIVSNSSFEEFDLTTALNDSSPNEISSSLININFTGPRKSYNLNQLLPFLQIYQTWFYGIWPVLSVANLITNLSNSHDDIPEISGISPISSTISSHSTPIVLNNFNASSYALCCAVNATIARHKVFLKSTSNVVKLDNCPTSDEFANEAIQISHLYDLKASPSLETLLISMFLHLYFSNIPNESIKGLMYLREAVTIAHVLKIHLPNTLIRKSSAEAHRIRKIYYLLLMTERYFSLENQYSPVLLDASIPIPSLKDEEYPGLLKGFIEINRVFASPDKQFFQEISTSQQISMRSTLFSSGANSNSGSYTNLQGFFEHQQQNMTPALKRQWIAQLQYKLSKSTRDFHQISNDSQRVNILLSKAWFKSLGWLISSQNYLINNGNQEDCFTLDYPVKIAHEFLAQTKNSAEFAFEQNGPGVAYKLLEIANSVYTYTLIADNTSLAFDNLNTLYNMILKFKVDMEISNPIFQKITDCLELRKFNFRRLSTSGNEDVLKNFNEKVYELDSIEQQSDEIDNSNNNDSNDNFSTSTTSTSSSSKSSINHDFTKLEELENDYILDKALQPLNLNVHTPGFNQSFNINSVLNSQNSPPIDSLLNEEKGLNYYLTPFLQTFSNN